MRAENNPLDLNNLPDDLTRDGKQILDESSSSGNRRKKNGGKDDSGKVYECRFCSLKFCKSQALGGHMNRHRQERETETLYRARQLIFGNDGTLAPQGPHVGTCQAIPGGYIPTGHLGEPTLPYRSMYPPPRYFSGSSSILQSQPQQPYLYSSPSRLMSYPSQYPHQQPVNDYCIGHVLGGGGGGGSSSSSSQYSTNSQHMNPMVAPETSYTCIGAPVGRGLFPSTGGGNGHSRGTELGSIGGRDGSLQSLTQGGEGVNWGRSYNAGSSHSQQRLDPSSMINRYPDGF